MYIVILIYITILGQPKWQASVLPLSSNLLFLKQVTTQPAQNTSLQGREGERERERGREERNRSFKKGRVRVKVRVRERFISTYPHSNGQL